MLRKNIRLQVGSLEGQHTIADDHSWMEKPVKMVYAGKFKSMDGDVEIKDSDIDKMVANHNSLLAKVKRLAKGDVPLTHQPPIQLDHSTSATHTVGRLIGDVTVGEHEDDDGNKSRAMMGTARILGKENVERVMDGRWSTVSIGADLEHHKITELSITPFPAAAGATMMKKGDEETAINPQLVGSGEDNMKLSYKETKEKAALYEKCRKHLTDHKKMSEEDADKHLSEADDDKLKHMSAEHDEHLKHLSEEESKKKEEDEKKKAEMSGQKANLVKLSKSFKESGKKVQLAEKQSKIHVRLSNLRAAAKITPAEVKALDIVKMSEGSDEAIEAALSSYEKREPVIDTSLLGTTKALTPSQLAGSLKKMNMEREELQTRLNMPLKRADALKRLAEIDKTEKELSAHEDSAAHLSDEDHDKHFNAAYDEHQKMSSEGKHNEAKEHLRSYMKSLKGKQLSEGASLSDPTPALSALAAETKKMQADFDALVNLAAPVFGATKEELG